MGVDEEGLGVVALFGVEATPVFGLGGEDFFVGMLWQGGLWDLIDRMMGRALRLSPISAT